MLLFLLTKRITNTQFPDLRISPSSILTIGFDRLISTIVKDTFTLVSLVSLLIEVQQLIDSF
jgi:hypothetical protein